MVVKAKQNLKEMKDKDEKFRKRKGQSSSEDVGPKKSCLKNGASSYKPSRFQKGQIEDLLLVLPIDLPLDLNNRQDHCLRGQEDLGP